MVRCTVAMQNDSPEPTRPPRGSPRGSSACADPVLLTIVPVLFLDFLVIALPRSIMPTLLDRAYGNRAYTLLGCAETIRGTLTFLFAPMLGALSDVMGRKWFFIACIVATSSPNVVLAFTPRLDVYLMALAMSGCLACTFPLAFAHISDAVPKHRRANAFGIATGVGLGGAFTIGPMLGAAIESWSGSHQTVFDLALWLTMINTLIATVAIRDARTPSSSNADAVVHGRREMIRRANPLGSLSLVRGNHALWTLSLIVFFYYLSLWGFIANSLLYSRRRFGLNSPAAAALLSSFGITSLLSQSIGLRIAARHLSEPQITRRCFACSFVALCMFGVAWEAWMLYPAMVLLGISVGGFACISSMASQVVPKAQTGEAQGVITSLKALTEGLGPLATSAALPWFEGTALPGAPWLISALWVALSMYLCLGIEHAVHISTNKLTAHTTDGLRGASAPDTSERDTSPLSEREKVLTALMDDHSTDEGG